MSDFAERVQQQEDFWFLGLWERDEFEQWMREPNQILEGKTPEQAIMDGDEENLRRLYGIMFDPMSG